MKSTQNNYRAIGLMSGTSMDGLDIIAVHFEKTNGKWQFQIEASDCIPYPSFWTTTLKNLHLSSLQTYAEVNVLYGNYLGEKINVFIKKHQL